MIAGKNYDGTNVDIWSSGIVLYAMVCGFLPFEDPDTSKLYKKILGANDNIDTIIPKFLSTNCRNFLKKILNTNPRHRYGLEDIKSHPWFNTLKPTLNTGYIFGSNEFPIDCDILTLMEDYDFKKEDLYKALTQNRHNHATTSYYLMQRKTIQSIPNSSKNSFCQSNVDKSIKNLTKNTKRELNNSVQYCTPQDDFNNSFKTKLKKKNIFNVSEKDTANTTEATSKYYNTSINFNQINVGKKRTVLESFNLASVNRHKIKRRQIARTLNPSFRQSPRSPNVIPTGLPIQIRLPASTKAPPKDFLYTKYGRFKRPTNFKDAKRLKLTQRRTATNSPNFNDMTMAPKFDDKRLSNGVFSRPVNHLNMTMYGKIMNLPQKQINSPGTSMQSQR